MITAEDRRNVATELRRQIGYMSERSKWYEDDIDVIECGNAAYRNIAASVERRGNAFQGNYIHIVERLADLIDRGECENVYDDLAYGSCRNGFKCSVCGCTVEDEEHYHVSGVWNFCPKCGKRVRSRK